MTVDQLIDLEIKVRGMMEDLEKEIATAEDALAPPSRLDGTEGRLSRQDSMLHHEIAKEGQRRRHQRLKLLREALSKMDAGEYGICGNCGGEITYARLDIQPETPICGACAEKHR